MQQEVKITNNDNLMQKFTEPVSVLHLIARFIKPQDVSWSVPRNGASPAGVSGGSCVRVFW
jgi:hypothetical protein